MKTETVVTEDPVRTAFVKMITRIDPEDFFCPGMKGLSAMVTLDDCELKAHGLGCSELKTCSAYLKKKRMTTLNTDKEKEKEKTEVRDEKD